MRMSIYAAHRVASKGCCLEGLPVVLRQEHLELLGLFDYVEEGVARKFLFNLREGLL